MRKTDRAHARAAAGATAAVAAVVAVADQAAKAWALHALEGRPPVEIIGDLLRLTLVHNPGAAFSMGSGSTWLFTTIQIAFIVGAAVAAPRVGSRWSAASLGLIAGGAAGNLVDRLFRDPGFYVGHVIDFISVRWFAVFNVADIGITVGVILLAARILLAPDPGESRADAPSDDDPGGRDDA